MGNLDTERLIDSASNINTTRYNAVDSEDIPDTPATIAPEEDLPDAKATLWTKARYYVPVLAWLPKYTFQQFIFDFVAGTSVAFLIIPQGLSYAYLAKMQPVYGLYGAFFPLVFYALLGTSRQLSIGPEAVVSLLIGAATTFDEEMDNEERLVLVGILSFLVGAILLLMGLLRLGFLDAIFSKATNRGFITGVAFVVMTEQLLKFFGIESTWDSGSSPIQKLIFVFSHLNEVKLVPTMFALCGFLFLLVVDILKRRYPKIMAIKLLPAIMIVVVVSILFSWGLQPLDLDILKDVEGGFVKPVWPSFTSSRLALMLPNAIVIVIVGFVESIIVAKLHATKNNYAVSDNRELVAVGFSNFLSSFFGAYSAFGSMPRTRMNDAAGARTQMAGAITSIYTLFTILFLLQLFYYLPQATLGAIIMFAAYSLLEFHDFAYFYKVKAWMDLVIAATCTLVTYMVGVEFGIFFTLAISIGLVIKNVTKDAFQTLGYSPDFDDFLPVSSKTPSIKSIEGLIIVQVLDSMFFANTGTLKDRLRRIELFGSLAVHPGSDEKKSRLQAVILDFDRMVTIDATSLYTIFELCEDYHRRGIDVLLARVNVNVALLFERAGILELVKQNHIYTSIKDAVAASKA